MFDNFQLLKGQTDGWTPEFGNTDVLSSNNRLKVTATTGGLYGVECLYSNLIVGEDYELTFSASMIGTPAFQAYLISNSSMIAQLSNSVVADGTYTIPFTAINDQMSVLMAKTNANVSAGEGFYLHAVNLKHKKNTYIADVKSTTDYYAFGSILPGRSFQPTEYAYGFQNQEKDDEIADVAGAYVNYKYRVHNTRLGRFFAVDPLTSKYPYYTPYSFSGNRVIDAIELEGAEPLLKNEDYTKQLEEQRTSSTSSSTSTSSSSSGASSGVMTTTTTNQATDGGVGYAAATAVSTVLLIDDASGVGVFDDWLIPVLFGVAYVYDNTGSRSASIAIPRSVSVDYADDGVNSIANSDGFVTLFRGVHPNHPDYDNAKIGVATPQGGSATPAQHNRGNNASVYTSWTYNPFMANYFATNQGNTTGGLVLIKRVHVSEITPSPDFMNQSEVLLKGVVTGAIPIPAVKF